MQHNWHLEGACIVEYSRLTHHTTTHTHTQLVVIIQALAEFSTIQHSDSAKEYMANIARLKNLPWAVTRLWASAMVLDDSCKMEKFAERRRIACSAYVLFRQNHVVL